MHAAKEFLSLINQHQNIIHKVCNIYMHDMADKEDHFQEITLPAWNAYKNFRGDSKFSTCALCPPELGAAWSAAGAVAWDSKAGVS